jgi:hypothetical protein
MSIRKITVIILLTISTFHTYSQSRVYHVSKNGNDNNPGTKISPFRTLQKVSEILNQGDSCIVHAGVYRELLSPKNNGLQNKPIVIMAAKGEKVIISGMETINKWKEGGSNTYKAKVPWTLGESNMVLINSTIGFEARFPNKTNLDPFDIQGGEIIEEGLSRGESEIHSNPYRFKTEIIPEKWASENLKDGKIWVLAQHKWGAWTAPVEGYNAKEKMLYFTKFGRDSLSVASNHNPNMMNKAYGRSIFYMFGSKVFLDAPNEWYFDKKAKELYIILPDNKKPIKGQVEFRKRTVAIDLQNKKFWKVSGFEIEGGTINLGNAENCTISHCKISYFWVSFPTQSASAMNDNNSGIVISGKNNVIQYSELAYSAGAGITLSGENNQVVNNLMHHFDYIGSIRAGAINVSGIGHQISHNTIHSVGRDCIKLGGANQTICYNNIYNPGLICEDVGVLYSGGTDYEMMQIHHNLVHNDNSLKKSALGIYFDNFTNNGIAHHNIVWGIKEGIRLNRPGNYHLIYNNIVVEINNAYGPWQGSATQFGSAIVNNFTLNPIRANAEVFLANNVIGFPFDTKELLSIKGEISEGINKYGFPKYVGAFSDETDNWTAGHDFNRTSIPLISRELPFMRNYIENGSFEWQRNRSHMSADNNRIDHWEKSGEAELNFSAGFNIPGPDTRNSIFGNSLLLKSDGAGISQKVKGLKPDFLYKIGVYVHFEETGEVILSVQSTQIHQSVSSNDFPTKAGWKLLVLSFRTGLKDVESTVQIRNIGNRNVYLDNIGLVPDLEKAEKEK